MGKTIRTPTKIDNAEPRKVIQRSIIKVATGIAFITEIKGLKILLKA
jgi:hypothetical protein